MTKSDLPPHIRQLVDKKNYVIAIKTYAQEQNISMEEAKNQIDAYEQQAQVGKVESQLQASQNTTSHANMSQLSQSVDQHLAQENIKMPLVPYWVKRVLIILLVIALLAFLFYRLLG